MNWKRTRKAKIPSIRFQSKPRDTEAARVAPPDLLADVRVRGGGRRRHTHTHRCLRRARDGSSASRRGSGGGEGAEAAVAAGSGYRGIIKMGFGREFPGAIRFVFAFFFFWFCLSLSFLSTKWGWWCDGGWRGVMN